MDESYIHTKGKTNEHVSRDPLPLCSDTSKETDVMNRKAGILEEGNKGTQEHKKNELNKGVQFK